jgi:hypothetical protein
LLHRWSSKNKNKTKNSQQPWNQVLLKSRLLIGQTQNNQPIRAHSYACELLQNNHPHHPTIFEKVVFPHSISCQWTFKKRTLDYIFWSLYTLWKKLMYLKKHKKYMYLFLYRTVENIKNLALPI